MKTTRSSVVAIFASLLISLSLAVRASAQSGVSTGSILGSVVDASGGVVPGAEVVVKNDTGYQRTVVSGDDGSYRALLLPPGNYELAVSRQGFKTFVRRELTLGVDQNLRVDVTLEVGSTTESVTVTGTATQVDTYSSQPSTVVTEKQLKDLPLAGNRYLAAVGTSPGVIPGGQRSGVVVYQYYNWLGPDPQSSGAQFNQTDFQIDSSSMRQGIWGGSSGVPTSVGIAEVKIIRNTFSAEYGTGAALVVNAVTKSGTNQFHGSLFDTLGNDKFNARSFTAGPKKAKLRYNQFGGDVGGPVVLPHIYNGKDKTYFYFNYEGIRLPQSAVVSGGLPPTAAQKTGDFSALSTPIIDPTTGQQFSYNGAPNVIPPDRLDPVAQYLLDLMPAANSGNEYRENFATNSYENQYTIRIDQNLGSKDRLYGRWWWNAPQSDGVSGTMPILPTNFTNIQLKNRSLTLSNNYSISPTLLTQTSFAYSAVRQNYGSQGPYINFQDVGINGWDTDGAPQTPPTFRISAYNLNIEANNPSQQFDTNYLFSQSLTWIHGRHSLKAGFEFGRWEGFYGAGPEGNGRGSGTFFFNGSFTGDALADFVLGRPSNLNRSDILPIPLASNRYAGFVMDDFRVSRRLTLNLGIRYRIERPWVHENGYGAVFIEGQQSQVIPTAPLGMNYVGDTGVPDGFYPTDYNDWAPRFGFAFDPTGSGKTAIRGGFGVYYNPMPWAPAYFTAFSQPYGLTEDFVPASLSDPFAGRTNPYPYVFDPNNVKFAYPVTVFPALPNNVRSAYVQSWSLGIQRQVNRMLLEATYVGSGGHKIMESRDINPALYIPGTDAQGNPLSTLQNIDSRRIIEPAPNTYGRIVLNTDYGNSTYHALQVSTRGRLTSNLLVTTAWTWGHSIDNVAWGRFVDLFHTSNPFDLANNKGNSNFDYRHIFTSSLVWDSPKLNAAPGLVRWVFGNWRLSTLFTAQTGMFLSVFAGQDRSLSGVGNDRADVLLPSSQFLDPASVTRGEQFAHYINPAAFGLPPIGTFGNSGRNIMPMPSRWVDDFSVQKRVPFSETGAVSFRANFYNGFNHTRLGGGIYNGGGGLIPVASPSFGRLGSAQSGRTIQFGLAVEF